jgi:hypothetical protein
MSTVFAVYQYAWRDSTGWEAPFGNGVTQPCRALIGLCRDRAKAVRIARRVRRAIAAALGPRVAGDNKALPLIDVGPYNPVEFLADQDRWRDNPTRAEAHRRAMAGVKDCRLRLGIA